MIVGFWIDYHILFLNVKRIDRGFILLNMLFILTLSLSPFTTGFAGLHYNSSFAVALLGFNYFITNLCFSFLYAAAKAKNLVEETYWKESKGIAVYSVIGLVMFLIAIPVAYINPHWPIVIFLIVFSGHLVKPIRRNRAEK